MEKNLKSPDYSDRVPKIWAAVLAGLAICAFGMREQLLVLVVEHPVAVAIVFLLSAGVAWCLIQYVSYHTRRLDRKWPWHTVFYQRLLRQVGWCVALPATAVLLFAIAFFYGLPQSVAIGDTHYFYSDFPLSVMLLVQLSTCYGFAYCQWYIGKLQAQAEKTETEHQLEVAALNVTIKRLAEENAALKELLGSGPEVEEEQAERKYALNDEGSMHSIPYAEIAYFCMQNYHEADGRVARRIELVLMDGTVFFAKEPSLVKVAEETGGFFVSVHRGYLVAPHGIDAATRDSSGKLTLFLKPDGRAVELSLKLARRLKAWVVEQVGTIRKETPESDLV